jgi:hypothetical protein
LAAKHQSNDRVDRTHSQTKRRACLDIVTIDHVRLFEHLNGKDIIRTGLFGQKHLAKRSTSEHFREDKIVGRHLYAQVPSSTSSIDWGHCVPVHACVRALEWNTTTDESSAFSESRNNGAADRLS